MATTTTPEQRISAPRSGTRGYDAFVSYSHAADGRLAPALQRGLQSLAKPWYRRRALRVFRDQTSLSASPELWSAIEAALSQARYFVLLASAEAAASHWVDQEVRWWRENRDHDSVLIVLTDGELRWDEGRGDFDTTAAIPPGLRGWFPREPLWVDLRWAREERDVSMRNPRFRDDVGELAAPIHGVPKDELIGEDISQQHRTLRLARGAVVLLVLLLAASVIGGVVAFVQRNRAVEQESLAVARELAAQSTNQQELNPELALLLGIQAFEEKATPETEDALRAALGDDHLRGVAQATARPLTSVDFSPDGESIVTAGDDGRAELWRVPSLRRYETLHAGPPGITHAEFGDRGRLVLTTNDSSATKIWSTETGRPVRTLPDQHEQVTAGTISQNGRLVATASGGRKVQLWRRGERRPDVLGPFGQGVTTLAFSPDGRSVAAGDIRGSISVWSISEPTSGRVMRGGHDYIWSVSFDRSGRALVASSADGSVRVLFRSGERTAKPYEGSSGTFYPPEPLTAQLSKDNELLAIGSDDGTLTVQGTSPSVPFEGFTTQTDAGKVLDLDFAPDGKMVVTAQADGSVRLFEVAAADSLLAVLGPARSPPTDVAFSPNGRLLAASDSMGTRVWTRSGRMIWSVPSGTRASFSPDGRLLAVAGSKGTIVRPVLAPHPTLRFPGASTDAAFSPDGRLLAIAAHGGDVLVRRVSDPEVVGVFPGRRGRALRSVEFSPNGSTLAALTTGGTVRIWNLEEKRIVHRLGRQGPPITGAAFSPSGRDIATVRGSRLIVTDVESGRAEGTPPLSAEPFRSVAYSSDGRIILVASLDGRAHAFDAGELRSFATLFGSGESLSAGAFSPNGTRVALGGDGGVWVRRCGLCAPPSRLLTIAQSKVTRDLTASERGRYLHGSD